MERYGIPGIVPEDGMPPEMAAMLLARPDDPPTITEKAWSAVSTC